MHHSKCPLKRTGVIPNHSDTSSFKITRLPNSSMCLFLRNGGPLSPEIGKFCGNVQPNNITSISNQLWIEYTAVEDPSDFEFVLEPENDGCGGTLHGNSREISSPK